MSSLHWADYLIMTAFLLTSLAIGIYHALTGGRQRTTQEFIMADRKLGLLPAMTSLLVSHQSAIMILGFVAEMYTRGTMAWPWILVGYSLALLLAERIYVPLLYPLKMVSVNQYLEMRFQSTAVRKLGCLLSVISMVFYMGTAMYAPSLVLETATGFPLEASIPLMAVVAVIYTALGGIKAVVWTDVFQFLIMFAGLLTIFVKANVDVGGFGAALEACSREGRLFWAEWSLDVTVRHTVWGFLIGWALTCGHLFGLHQASFQRYSATKSLRTARFVMWLNIPTLLVLTSLAMMNGITVFAHYESLPCDPLASGQIDSPNKILAHYVKNSFENAHGFSGYFLATLYSGALSSVSSSLSGSAAITWEDILKTNFANLSDFRATTINKVLVVVYGILAGGIAFLPTLMSGPITQITGLLLGATTGPITGMFLLGGFVSFADWKGALSGGLVGLALTAWIAGGSTGLEGQHPALPPISVAGCLDPVNVTAVEYPEITGLKKLYTLSYLWYAPLGALATLTTGVLVSLMPPKVRRDVPNKLLIRLSSVCTSPFRDDGTTTAVNDVQQTSAKSCPTEMVPMVDSSRDG